MIYVSPSITHDPIIADIFRFSELLYSIFKPIVSLLLPLAPICATLFVAQKARYIADQSKLIAKDKLDLDVFSKRYEVYLGYKEMLSKLITYNSLDRKTIDEKYSQYTEKTSTKYFLYKEEELNVFIDASRLIERLIHYRLSNPKISVILASMNLSNEYNDLKYDYHNIMREMTAIIKNRTPSILKE
jgi:hypothetical protein